MIRFLLWLGFGSLTLVTSVLAFTLTQESALRWIVKQSLNHPTVAANLSIDSIEGKLIGPINLRGIHYENEQIKLDIPTLIFDWDITKLLSSKIDITQLHLDQPHLELKNSTESKQSAQPIPLPSFQLPIDILLYNISVNQARISYSNITKNVNVTRLELAAHLLRDEFIIDKLKLLTPELSVKLFGKFFPANNTFNLTTDWSVQHPTINQATGNGTFHGSLQKVNINQRISAPININIEGTIHNPITALQWQAKIKTTPFNPHLIQTNWPDLMLNVSLDAEGDLQHILTRGNLYTQLDPIGSTHFDFKTTMLTNFKKMTIEKLSIHVPNHDIHIDTSGSLYLADDIHAQFKGKWNQLMWPLQGDSVYFSKAGKFSFSGKPEHYVVDIDTLLSGPQLPTGQWKVAAHGSLKEINISQLTTDILQGPIVANGNINWQQGIKWNISATGNQLNPITLHPDMPGSINAVLQSSGNFTNNVLNTAIYIDKFSGTIRDYPIHAQGDLSIDEQQYQINQFHLQSDDTRIQINGTINDNWALSWSVVTQDIHTLLPNAVGTINAQGTLDGLLEHPIVSANIMASNLHYKSLSVAELSAELKLDFLNQSDSLIDLDIHQLQYQDQIIDYIKLDGHGILTNHQLNMMAKQQHNKINITLSGQYHDHSWEGAINQLKIDSKQFGHWHNQTSSLLNINKQMVNLQHSCMIDNIISVCGRVIWHQNELMQNNLIIDLAIEELPSSRFAAYLPDLIQWQDTLSTNLNLTLLNNKLSRLTGEIIFGPGNVTIPDNDKKPLDIGYNRGEITFDLDNNDPIASYRLSLKNNTRIAGKLRLPQFKINPEMLMTQAIQGKLQANINDLRLLSIFVPVLSDIEAQSQLNINVAGLLTKPELTGKLSIQKGRLNIIDLGLTLSDIYVDAKMNQAAQLAWQATGKSGDGTIAITGTTNLDIDNFGHSEMNIISNNTVIVNNADIKLYASSDLNINYSNRSISYAGTIKIPQGHIHLKDTTNVVNVSDDIIIISDDNTENSPLKPLQVTTKIRLIIGNKISIEGFGLTGKLQGNLEINQTPGNITTGRGELSILGGQYSAFGKDLVIERGKVVFAGGSLDNPGLDIKATRTFEEETEILVGVLAQGRLESPELLLFSEPSMQETDILSYLVLGRRSRLDEGVDTDLNNKEDALATAAAALSTQRGYLAAQKLAQRIGIDETRISRRGLVLGTSVSAISPNLYINYILDSNLKNVFQIRYKLSHLWQIISESAEQSHVDLLYSIEK